MGSDTIKKVSLLFAQQSTEQGTEQGAWHAYPDKSCLDILSTSFSGATTVR